MGQGGLIDGLDEAVRGLSAGESKTFTSQLVAGEYAGKDAEITATVTAVKERELPDADDEFAQLASEFDTLDELTDDLRARLGQVKRMEQVGQARDKVLEALVDATEVPLPESVVTAEVESRLHDAVHAFDHDDERFAQFLDAQGKSREEFDADVRTEAERNVKTRLVLDALAEQEQVSVNDQELTERILYQAQQYQMPPEEFVRRIQEAGQLGAIYSDVRRSKALIAAVAAATVTDESGGARRPVRPDRQRRRCGGRGRVGRAWVRRHPGRHRGCLGGRPRRRGDGRGARRQPGHGRPGDGRAGRDRGGGACARLGRAGRSARGRPGGSPYGVRRPGREQAGTAHSEQRLRVRSVTAPSA